MKAPAFVVAVAGGTLVLSGLGRAEIQAPTPSGIQFTDVTAAAGVKFRHTSGAFGKKYLPETMGSGVAFLDADGDGWQDLLFAQSTSWPGKTGTRSHPTLYRNNHDGTVSAASLPVEMYGLGVAAADYDDHGDGAIQPTGLGPDHLFRNTGGGRFEDVTAKAGVADTGFSTSALWFDYDRDGRLDLFVGHYVDWSIEKDLFCTLDGRSKSYCTPESYKGQSATLFHNVGNGRFDDVTATAGIADASAKGLGVALLDYHGDGWIA